jgi:hypothetical protein
MKLLPHREGFLHRCPGCNSSHYVATSGNPSWTFSGDDEKPSFSPSIKVSWGNGEGSRVCHYFIREGNIEYCPDSTHELAGKTVPLPEYQ